MDTVERTNVEKQKKWYVSFYILFFGSFVALHARDRIIPNIYH